MSAAFVPGLILLVDALSSSPTSSGSCMGSRCCDLSPLGDLAPIWTSVNGGGLGRRGELEGDILPEAAGASAAAMAIFFRT